MSLEKILGAELFAEVSAKLGDTKVMTYTGDNAPVSYERFKEVNESKKLYKESADATKLKLDEVQGQLKGFEGMEGVDQKKFDEMRLTVETLQSDLVTKGKELVDFQKKSSLMGDLKEAGVKKGYENILAREFNLDDFELKDGKLVGLEDKLKGYKETLVDMFGEVNPNIIGANVSTNAKGEKKTLYTREELKQLTSEDITANMELVNESMAALQ